MRIVVTGGSGNIGSHVVRALAAAGHEVLNLDLRRPRDPDLPGRYVHTDLARRDVLEPRLADFAPDGVCHLGEIANVYQDLEERVYGRNATSTGTLFQACADLGVSRIAYASSGQVYGVFGSNDEHPSAPPLRLPLDESEPARPNNAYGAQKAGAELYLASLAHRYGLTTAALRIPGCRDYRKSRWIGRLMRHENADRLYELGAWLDASDAGDAFARCVTWTGEPPWSGHESFNVAADTTMHRPDAPPVRAALAEHRPTYPPLPEDWPDHAAPYSSEKFKQATGWSPAVGVEDLWAAADL